MSIFPHAQGADDDTLDIRIASVFVVLVSGMIGGIPPLYLKVTGKDAWVQGTVL